MIHISKGTIPKRGRPGRAPFNCSVLGSVSIVHPPAVITPPARSGQSGQGADSDEDGSDAHMDGLSGGTASASDGDVIEVRAIFSLFLEVVRHPPRRSWRNPPVLNWRKISSLSISDLEREIAHAVSF